jgi:hypothetical protein
MRPPEFDFQCAAKSKRSGVQCKNYHCRGRKTCRMHGGTTKEGVHHPNWQHGRYSRSLKELTKRIYPRPDFGVTVLLFPWSLEETMQRRGRGPLHGLVVQPEQMTIGQWMQALRAARRYLAQELAEIRQEVAKLSEQGTDRPPTPEPSTDRTDGTARGQP